jgi:glycogen operon protein
MLCGGDELGRTQQGNNNAYCQDNEISWLDWERAREFADLFEFTRSLLALRKAHPVFRRRRFFQGRAIRGAGVKDLTFFEPSGAEMTDQAWDADFVRSLMVLLGGDSIDETDADGIRVSDDTFLLLLNAHQGSVVFTLPIPAQGMSWECIFDTGNDARTSRGSTRTRRYRLRAHALALFRTRRGHPRRARQAAPAPDPTPTPDR